MVRKRPGVVTAMAVINMVFGILGLLGLLCSGLGFVGMIVLAQAQPAAAGQPDLGAMPRFIDQEVPELKYVMAGALAAAAIRGFLLLFSGIGLLKMRRWGRTMGLAYGVIALLTGPAEAAWMGAVGNPG